MKRILVILAVFFLSFVQAQQLKGKVTYSVTLQDSYIDKFKIDEISVLKDTISHFENKQKQPLNFHLLFDGNKATYKAEYDLFEKRELGFKIDKAGGMARHQNIYFIDLKTKENFYQSFWTKDILVDIEPEEWLLIDETKKIGDYVCHKATTTITTNQLPGRTVTEPIIAWYTKEVPVSFGIQSFNGLPGLIIEMNVTFEDVKINYLATTIDLNPKESIIIEKPEGTRRMSENEYADYIKELNSKRKRY